MTPLFDPGPNPYGPPPVWLGRARPAHVPPRGRGRRRACSCTRSTPATTCASTVAPAVEAGRAEADRSADGFTVHACPIVCTGSTDEELERGRGRRPPARRVLRFDARVPRDARRARLGRPPDRAACAHEVGPVGRSCRHCSPTRSSTRSWCAVHRARSPRHCRRGTRESSIGSGSRCRTQTESDTLAAIVEGFRRLRAPRPTEHRS